jgi:hypothetical protein
VLGEARSLWIEVPVAQLRKEGFGARDLRAVRHSAAVLIPEPRTFEVALDEKRVSAGGCRPQTFLLHVRVEREEL